MAQKKSIKRKIRNSIVAARELGYPASIVEKLKSAATEIEIERILATARNQT